METKIEVSVGDSLENVVEQLLEAKARGEHVYCDFNGHELHSDNVTMDSAFKEVTGLTKEEHDRREKEWHENYKRREKEREERERGYAEKVNASRTEDNIKITEEKVVNGLKFIAEHPSMSQEELIDGLLKLGCNFSLEDITQQFPEGKLLFPGMRDGDLASGATVIANVRDSEIGRAYGDDRFLSVDDDTSIYNFIRVRTGDQTYTKEKVSTICAANAEKESELTAMVESSEEPQITDSNEKTL